MNFSDSKFDCNFWGDSKVDCWPGDDSVGDFYAEDKRAEGLDHARRVSSECFVEDCSDLCINSSSCERRREVMIILRRKVRYSCRTGRVGRQFQRTERVRRRFQKRILGKRRTRLRWKRQKVVVQKFSNIIWLFSCSAFWFAMFKSNRRFKPGD